MKSLIEASLAKSKIIIFVFFIIVLVGSVSYSKITKTKFPDVEFPQAFINVSFKGISPADGSDLLIKPLLDEIEGMEGVKKTTSKANEGWVSVTIEFQSGYNLDKGINDLKDAVDKAKTKFPIGYDEPVINEISSSDFPVLKVNLANDQVDAVTLKQIADDLKDLILSVPGVLEVNTTGVRDLLVSIIINQYALDSYKISASDLMQLFYANNSLINAGEIEQEQGKLSIKANGLIKNLQEIYDIPIKSLPNGQIVYLKDVATIQKGFSPEISRSRLNNKRSISFEITKKKGINLVNVISDIKKAIENFNPSLPENSKIVYTEDSSSDVNDFLNTLINSVLFTILVVSLIILIFLDIRSSFLVSIIIPVSFMVTISVLYFTGSEINLVVLFSMVMLVGMLVDNAIIVIEASDKYRKLGFNNKDSFINASKSMAMPILGSTLTTLAAYFPLLYWPGTLGSFLIYLPITFLLSLSTSFVVAIFIIPALGIWLGDLQILLKSLLIKLGYKKSNSNEKLTKNSHKIQKSKDELAQEAIARADFAEVGGIIGKYGTLVHNLTKTKLNSWLTILVIFMIVVLIIIIFNNFNKGTVYFPKEEPSQARISVRSIGNLSLDERDNIIKKVEDRVSDFNDFKNITSQVLLNPSTQAAGYIGRVVIDYEDWRIRQRSRVLVHEIKQKIKDLYGLIIKVSDSGGAGGPPTSSTDIKLDLLHDSHTILINETTRIIDLITKLPYIDNVESNISNEIPEWQYTIDRDLATKYGIQISEISNYIALATSRGVKLDDFVYSKIGESIDIVMKVPKHYNTIKAIDEIKINTLYGLVPLSNFVKGKLTHKVSTINFVNKSIGETLKIDVKENYNVNESRGELAEFLNNNLQNDVKYKFSGDAEAQKETSDFLLLAFGIIVFSIFFMLLLQFNSFYETFVVIFAIVFAIIGVLLAIVISRTEFSIVMTGLGIVSLAGVAINNNIVLIDAFNINMNKFKDFNKAIVATVMSRIRPITLTTLTTFIGLLPVALKISILMTDGDIEFGDPASDIWAPLAIASAGGILISSCIVLVLTPCLLSVGRRFCKVEE